MNQPFNPNNTETDYSENDNFTQYPQHYPQHYDSTNNNNYNYINSQDNYLGSSPKTNGNASDSTSLSVGSSLQRSNSKVNYSSPLLRSHSRSGSSNPSPTQSPSPSPSPLKRNVSILKNGPKDAAYLSSNMQLNQAWEPAGPNAIATPSSPPPLSSLTSGGYTPHALAHYGSASNLRAAVAATRSHEASVHAHANAQAQAQAQAQPSQAHAPSQGPGAPGQGPVSTSDPTQPAIDPSSVGHTQQVKD